MYNVRPQFRLSIYPGSFKAGACCVLGEFTSKESSSHDGWGGGGGGVHLHMP